ncbi:STAS domain protein [Ancylostoma ceylanicum]|uniref:STAS domain protein n=1 Tax=Ancylostoma ceylanicum TaxID=53326 RepID=A0A0D6LJZ5_9BILA|nr:STAS domain protein [Ancylostoma ceylanicum]
MAVHISMAKLLAKKYRYPIDTKQEFFAAGLTSTISSFFPVFPSSCSLARTLVNASAGTRTQAIWIVAFLATACVDVMDGLAIAIVFALLTTVFRLQWPNWHILANVTGTMEYRDVERYRQGICIVRFDAPLLFTNVGHFRAMIEYVSKHWDNLECNSSTTEQSSEEEDEMVYEELLCSDIRVFFAAPKAPVRELFEAAGLYNSVKKSNFYPTLYDAMFFAQHRRSQATLAWIRSNESSYDTVVLSDDSTQDDSPVDRKLSWYNPVYSAL